MRDFPLEDERETYRLGAHFHTLVGMAEVCPIEIRRDAAGKSWFFEGLWKKFL